MATKPVPASCKLTHKAHPLNGYRFPRAWPEGVDDVPQSAAKSYLPPGATIWRSNNRGAWCIHPAGHARSSVPWVEHDGNSKQAMLAAIRICWELYIEDKQLPAGSCPIKGVFP